MARNAARIVAAAVVVVVGVGCNCGTDDANREAGCETAAFAGLVDDGVAGSGGFERLQARHLGVGRGNREGGGGGEEGGCDEGFHDWVFRLGRLWVVFV